MQAERAPLLSEEVEEEGEEVQEFEQREGRNGRLFVPGQMEEGDEEVIEEREEDEGEEAEEFEEADEETALLGRRGTDIDLGEQIDEGRRAGATEIVSERPSMFNRRSHGERSMEQFRRLRPSISRSSIGSSVDLDSDIVIDLSDSGGAMAEVLQYLHDQAEDTNIDGDRYLRELETETKNDKMVVGRLSLAATQREQAYLEERRIEDARIEAELQRVRDVEYQQRATKAKNAVDNLMKGLLQDQADLELKYLKNELVRHEDLQKNFQRQEDRLTEALKAKGGELKTVFGNIEGFEEGAKGMESRTWKVDWVHSPQPVQIHLEMLRATKEKLPKGNYVMLVSLYDYLGGYPIRWKNFNPRKYKWERATNPVHHRGRFYDIDLVFDQSVFIVSPSARDILPSMVFIFELFLLKGNIVQKDTVLGWGAFPAADGRFENVQGRFKIPLLRGEVDPTVFKYQTFENVIRKDLDLWLANLYFEVLLLPKYTPGQKEYDVELMFSYDFGLKEEREIANASLYKSKERRKLRLAPEDVELDYDMDELGKLGLRKRFRKKIEKEKKAREKQRELQRMLSSPRSDGPQSPGLVRERSKRSMNSMDRGPAEMVARTVTEKALLTSDSQYLSAVKNERKTNEEKQNFLGRQYSKWHLMGKQQGTEETERIFVPDNYHVSVAPPTRSWNRVTIATEKVQYIRKAMLRDLGLNNWRRMEFYWMIFIILFTCYIRFIPHYFGVWLYLQAFNVPIENEQWYWYYAKMDYRGDWFNSAFEVGSVSSGTVFNLMVFIFLCIVSWVSQKLLGSFPDTLSRFVFAFGIGCLLDPVFVVLIDVIIGNVGGDSFRLYNYYLVNEGNGVVGIFLTFFIYLLEVLVSFILLYNYSLRLHMNGRMMDVYYRLHGQEEDFFIPHDHEVSSRFLHRCLMKAQVWRGENDAQRKIAIWKYKEQESSLFLERLYDMLSLRWPSRYFEAVRLDNFEMNSQLKHYARKKFPAFAHADHHNLLTETIARNILASYFLEDYTKKGWFTKPAIWLSPEEALGRIQGLRNAGQEVDIDIENSPLDDIFEIRNENMLADALFWEIEEHADRLEALYKNLEEFGFLCINPGALQDNSVNIANRNELRRHKDGLFHICKTESDRKTVITIPREGSRRKFLSATHVVIFTQTLSMKKELYRHFIRGPDGTICEVFVEEDGSEIEKARRSIKSKSRRDIEYWMYDVAARFVKVVMDYQNMKGLNEEDQ